MALACIPHIGLLARQGGQRRALHLPLDHVLSHLESHEEAFCSRVVRREGGLLGRCCVRGSSPLQAALRRLVADELTQHTDNQEACTVERLHDSISLSLVARAGLKLASLPVVLGLALLTYAGVRFLTAGCSGFSQGIVINNGVVAGCAQGNHAARLALHNILQNSHELHSERSLRRARWPARRWRRL